MSVSTRTWLLNGLPLNRPGQYFVEADTASPGSPAPRVAVTQVPGLDGAAVNARPRLEIAEVGFRIAVEDCDDRGRSGGYAQRRVNEASIKRQLAGTLIRPGVLTLVEENTRRQFTRRETQAILNSEIAVEELTESFAVLSFTWLLPEPVWVEPSKRMVELRPDKNGVCLLAKLTGGSAMMWPLWALRGPAQRVEIVCTVSGSRTVWIGDVQAGQVLLLDPKRWAWGVASEGVWPWKKDRPEWGAVLTGSQAAFDDAGGLSPDWLGRYSATITINGHPLPVPSGEVPVGGLCLGQRSFL